MAEMYSKNHAVSYILNIIKQTVDTINCNDYMLRLYFAIVIKQKHPDNNHYCPSCLSLYVFAYLCANALESDLQRGLDLMHSKLAC